MNQPVERHEGVRLADPAAIAMAAFALPLFVWSAFNGGFFDFSNETFIIPLAVFFGGPVAFAAAMWAYHRRDAYLGTVAGLFGSFWITYGMLLWLIQNGTVTEGTASGDLRGLFFAAWAVTFGILWLASMREHWALSLVTLGGGAMFVLLSIAYYSGREGVLTAAGWIGFLTAGLTWYTALAEMLNAEFARPVLPADWTWFDRFRLGTRTR